MQAQSAWQPPTGILGRLTEQSRDRALTLQGDSGALERLAAGAPVAPSLAVAVRQAHGVALIAEVKRRSPSKGELDGSIDAAARARDYLKGGAAALSVLTEPRDFGGANDDLVAARQAVPIPVLKKDFHVDPVQLFEARALGASAALLIMRALGPEGTARMATAARTAGIEAVFEVRSEDELAWAIDAGAAIIGVNRRNLETLEMEPEVLHRILPRVPSTCVAIAESGITTRADVEEVATLGADAVLVGSFLSVSRSVPDAVAALCGVPRGPARG